MEISTETRDYSKIRYCPSSCVLGVGEEEGVWMIYVPKELVSIEDSRTSNE